MQFRWKPKSKSKQQGADKNEERICSQNHDRENEKGGTKAKPVENVVEEVKGEEEEGERKVSLYPRVPTLYMYEFVIKDRLKGFRILPYDANDNAVKFVVLRRKKYNLNFAV